MTVSTPEYRRHKGSGQALAQINGNRIYLGKYGPEESKEKYRRLVAEFFAAEQRPKADESGVSTGLPLVLIKELILGYWQFAKNCDVKDGKPTGTLSGIRVALRPLRRLYGGTPANLAQTAEDAWIALLGSKDRLTAEAIRRQLAEIKEQLGGDAPSVIEKMLGDQIVATLLEVQYLELVTADTKERTITQAALLLKRLDLAQRRHANAIRSLVQVRKLLLSEQAGPRLSIFAGVEKTA